MTMPSLPSNSSGSSLLTRVVMACDSLTSLIRLLVLGAQLESSLVTYILVALICGNEFSLERAFSS